MRAFLAHSFSESGNQKEVLNCISEELGLCGIETFSFVRSYPPYGNGEESIMMNDAFSELSRSDILVAEASDKAIGVGIEAGYARAKNILIIYLYRTNCDVSKTLKGCADFTVRYSDIDSLRRGLKRILEQV